MTEERVPTLSLAVALAAGGTAACAASATRWWLFSPFHGPAAVLLAVGVGAWIGQALARAARSDDSFRKTEVPAAAIAASGPISAFALCAALQPKDLAGGIIVGTMVCAVLVPLMGIGLSRARAALRSRARSLVGDADRRAPLRVSAIFLGSIVAVTEAIHVLSMRAPFDHFLWWGRRDRMALAQVPLAVAAIGVVIAAFVWAADRDAVRVVSRAQAATLRLRGHDVEDGATIGTLDVGIGDAAWIEQLGGVSTYRSDAIEHVAVRGDLEVGPILLGEATTRSKRALAIVFALTTLSVQLYAMCAAP